MTTYRETAPGKVILFGEHAVVYGRPAIAVPVTEVFATAKLTPAPTGSGFRVVAPDLGQAWLLAGAAPDQPLVAAVKITLAHFKQTKTPDAVLTVSSTIPLGRGLGSGAAISTAIVRVLARFLGQPLPTADVSRLVFEVEKLYHGTPSGIDNTVVAFRQPVYFIKGRPIQRMRVASPFTLLVGDTGVVASTRKVVGNLRRRRQANPELYEGYFDEIGVIARHAKLAIEQEMFDAATLGKLMNENQDVLESMDISSPELQRLVTAARNAGAWGAKLSGAGWGGNMIALLPPDAETISAVRRALLEAGAVGVLATTVSHLPEVLNPVTGVL